MDSEYNRPLVFSSIIATLAHLKRMEYRLKFIRGATGLFCFELNEWISPDHFTVDESFYFQEIANPDADRMLYAISLSQEVKGFLIDTCGIYADNISLEMIQKLKQINAETNFKR